MSATISRMANSFQVSHRQALVQSDIPDVRINFSDARPNGVQKGTVLLIHGFPQSAYQYRHVIGPFAAAGYRVIAPDTRGHGFSSKPLTTDWTKRQLARDLFQLVSVELGIQDEVHVVGHDIGGMIAHAYVCQFPNSTASVVWGECPLPGTSYYESEKHSPNFWHFDFHSHDTSIAVALVAGKEQTYISHFFDRQSWNHAALSPDVVKFYAAQYAMPDAMRCAFLTYQAFEEDARENRRYLAEHGKIDIPSMILSGEGSWAAPISGAMALEMYSDVTEAVVPGSGHYLAEENPKDFVDIVLAFIRNK